MLAGVETIGIARLGEELLGLGRIVDRLRRLPEIFEGVGDDAAGDLRIAERNRAARRTRSSCHGDFGSHCSGK